MLVCFSYIYKSNYNLLVWFRAAYVSGPPVATGAGVVIVVGVGAVTPTVVVTRKTGHEG